MGLLLYAPLERLIDANAPPPPARPAYQPRYPVGAKPIPTSDLLLPPPPPAAP
jgi:hypothetical protein